MLATVYSGAVLGVDAYQVEIEVNAGGGDPQVVIVGLPDTAVKESRDRVYTAINNSGFKPHVGRTTINLAPANIKKEGPIFDLPIAIGMIAAQVAEGSSGLADHDDDGQPMNYDDRQISALLVAAVQDLGERVGVLEDA